MGPHEIKKYLQKIKTNKPTAPGDIPAKIIKEFAFFICIPMANIINTLVKVGQWPKIYKKETITPIPKQYPPESMEMLRPISNLPNLNKIMEKIICEMVISDMKKSLDPSQYGNQKHLSIQHYLVRLLHRIVSNIYKNCKGEINAALCMFIDWKQAYSRQCHTLGVKSFLKNGVRPALIPILISYFQDREMKVKWQGLSISIDSGGYCLGIGVMVSFLYIFGHWPTDRPVLMMFAIGIQIKQANSLIIFAGISPGTVDLFVFIFWRYFLVSCGLYCGMDDLLNNGMSMSSFLISLYSLLITEKLLARRSACSYSERWLISST